MTEQGKEATLPVGGLLGMAETLLARQRIPSPRRVAEMLMAHVLGTERYRVRLNVRAPLAPAQSDLFLELVSRRLKGEPVQYLVGSTEFMSLPFEVNPSVLIPRPETEVLVESVISVLGTVGGMPAKMRAQRTAAPVVRVRSPLDSIMPQGHDGPRKIVPLVTALDLGTGSGAIALSLAHYLPRLVVYAVDASGGAIELARRNAAALRLDARVRFLEGDLFDALEDRGLEENFAALVANPPYVATPDIAGLPREVRDHEPRLALDGGPDGLDVVRRIILGAPRWLRPGGLLALEVGAGQAPRSLALLREHAIWRNACVIPDYTGIDRVVMAERGGR